LRQRRRSTAASFAFSARATDRKKQVSSGHATQQVKTGFELVLTGFELVLTGFELVWNRF
jgi:hypothetical protein